MNEFEKCITSWFQCCVCVGNKWSVNLFGNTVLPRAGMKEGVLKYQ